MKKIITLTLTLPIFLVSCGGGGSSSSPVTPVKINCDKNIASTATANSIQLTVKNWMTDLPLENVVVQIDHDGKCIFSDADGKVNFENLTAAPHDVHVFGQKGFGWKSYFDVAVSDIEVTTLPDIKIKNPSEKIPQLVPANPNTSYILFSGEILYPEANSKISFQHFSDIKHTILEESVIEANAKRTHDLRYSFNKAVGTSFNDELWAFETIDVNGDLKLVDASHVQALNRATTTLEDSNGVLNSIDTPITFSLGSQKFKDLMIISSLTLPTGFTFKQLNISAVLTSSALGTSRLFRTSVDEVLYTANQYDLATSRTFDAYFAPFAANQTTLDINARSGSNATWRYVGNVPVSTGFIKATTFAFTPILTTVPSLFAPIGDTIKWSSVSNVVLQQNRIQILGGTGTSQKRWNIETTRASNSVTLPKLPAGLVPLLVKGDSYSVSLLGSYEYDAVVGTGKATESYSSFITWKR